MMNMNGKVLPLLWLGFVAAGWMQWVTAATNNKPNVLFIAIDDLRPELGSYGARAITPHIDQLAASGYETIGLGKIYHGTSGAAVDIANWSRWLNIEAPHYALPENAKTSPGGHNGKPKGPSTEAAAVPDDTYLDGMRAKRAAELLMKLGKDQTKPFFLAVGFTKPHLPFVAPKKYWDLYQRDELSMPSNQTIPPGYPKQAANLRAHEMNMYADAAGIHPKNYPDELRNRLIHGYLAATSYTDANVGRVLDALKSSGLANQTIVVLWGDHGYKLGNHGTWVKHTNFEIDTRVPLIVRAPRSAANGQATNQLVELIDLYPTLCDLADIPTPPHCQGHSFRKLLENPAANHRDSAYSCYPSLVGMGHSIRIGNYRYTEWRKDQGKPIVRVLTNIQADPGETTNVIDDPAHAAAFRRASDHLQQRIASARKHQN